MKTINYGQSSFDLSDEEFDAFKVNIQNSKMVWVSRLGVFLTDKFIWAGSKPSDPNIRLLHDGSKAIRKFGTWYSAAQPDIKIDIHYYPELLKDVDVEEHKMLGNV